MGYNTRGSTGSTVGLSVVSYHLHWCLPGRNWVVLFCFIIEIMKKKIKGGLNMPETMPIFLILLANCPGQIHTAIYYLGWCCIGEKAISTGLNKGY